MPAAAVLIVVMTAAIYIQTLPVAPLDYEDSYYLVRNPHLDVRNPLASLSAIWTEPYFANYHPVTTTTWLVDRLMADEKRAFDGRPFRAFQLVYAAAGAILLMTLLLRVGLPRVLAVAGALLFAAHPIRTEVVAWLSARKDLVVLIGILLSLLAYLHARSSLSAREWHLRHATTAGLCLLALLAKPIAVILPALFVAFEYCAPRPAGESADQSVFRSRLVLGFLLLLTVGGGSTLLFRSLLESNPSYGAGLMLLPVLMVGILPWVAPKAQEFAPFVDGTDPGFRVLAPPCVIYSVLFGLGSAWTFWAQGESGAIKGGLPLAHTLNLTFEAMLAYAGRTVIPAKLSVSYVWNEYALLSLRGVAGLLLTLSLAATGWLAGRSSSHYLRMAAFGIFWYLIAFVPVSNLVPTSTKMADRYLVVPLAGAILAAVALAAHCCTGRKAWQTGVLSVLFVATAGYAFGAYRRTEVWCGKTAPWSGTPNPDLSLWKAAVESDPSNWYAWTSLGQVYVNLQPPDATKAIDALRRALAITESQKLPEGVLLDTSLVKKTLGLAYLAAAQDRPANGGAGFDRTEALSQAVRYLGESAQRLSGFPPQDARLLENLARASEDLAFVADERSRTGSPASRQRAADERDRLRGVALSSLERARDLLLRARLARDEAEVRRSALAPGTLLFERGAAAAETDPERHFRAAIALYRKAGELFPADPRPAFYTGLCYERLYPLTADVTERTRVFDEAMAAFRKALSLRESVPDYHPLLPYRALASLYNRKGDLNSALESLKQVRALDPAYSRASGVDSEIATLEHYLDEHRR